MIAFSCSSSRKCQSPWEILMAPWRALPQSYYTKCFCKNLSHDFKGNKQYFNLNGKHLELKLYHCFSVWRHTKNSLYPSQGLAHDGEGKLRSQLRVTTATSSQLSRTRQETLTLLQMKFRVKTKVNLTIGFILHVSF